MDDRHCAECGAEYPPVPHTGPSGYGIADRGTESERKLCYACCAKRERQHMIDTGRTSLYLTQEPHPTERYLAKYIISDFAGELKFAPLRIAKGRHNITGKRLDVWFVGPDNHIWHGWNPSPDWQDIIHCRRTKQTLRT